jgi:hypothetical protein
MQKNKNRSGLALSVVAALLGTIFAGVTPAQALETAPVTVPLGGTASQSQILHGEEFELTTRLGASMADRTSKWAYKIEVSSTSPVSLSAGTAALGFENVISDTISAGVSGFYQTTTSAATTLKVSLKGTTSLSPAITVTVTPYSESDAVVGPSAGDILGDPFVVSFVPWSVLGSSTTLTQPIANDQGATASVTVQPGSLNWSQLNGNFHIRMTHAVASDRVTVSHAISGARLASTSNTVQGTSGTDAGETRYGNFSASFKVMTHPFSTSSRVDSLSAQLFYDQDAAGTLADGEGVAAAIKLAVTAQTITGVTVSPVVGTNLKHNGTAQADARVNSAFTLNAFAHSVSQTTSMAVASVFTVSAISNIDLDADSGVIIGTTTYTTSAALLAAGVTQPAGTTTVAISTFGQGDNSGYISFVGKSQGITSTALRVNLAVPSYTVDFDGANASSVVGSAKSFAVAVKDQWKVASTRTDQRVAASAVVSGSQSETVSAAVSAGAATVAVTPLPATRTASNAVVTFTLQTFNQGTGQWVNGATDTVTLNIYATADAFVTGGGAASSTSVSISHVVRDRGWSYSANALTYTVLNSYSTVVVSAPGLVIQDTATGLTASGTLTLEANVKSVSLKFAGTKAGTSTVTLTNGTATTTSQVIIDPAGGENGTAVTIAVSSSAVPQKAIDVVVTVTDLFGNPVDTATASQLTVIATGAGFFSNGARELTATTDANGQATFTLTSGANDAGSLTLIATYTGTAKASASAVVAIAPAPVATAQTVSVVASAATVEAGKNADVTITVTDSDGKAHAYKSVVVYSTGAGYLSAQTVTTDGNGKAVVKLLTGANESGTATITASVGGKSGTATVTVLAPVVVVPEVNVVVGTFNGRWAVRVENAKGSAVTVKVGNKWFKFTALSNSYTYSGKSKVGVTSLVKVWVDGDLQNEQTLTIK